MHQALENLEGIAVIADDILVYGNGETLEEARVNHKDNLRTVLERCRQQNIKINKEKLKLRRTELKYLGRVITGKGIKPDDDKVSAVKHMKSPKDKTELKRFLGMISYLSKFLPSMSTTTECLR